jgi:hypothetical protein
VTTLAEGRFVAKEKLLRCDRTSAQQRGSCPTVGSEQLARIVPPGQSFGYDLIVHVGLARYLDGKQRAEIQAALERQGVELSTGTISNLCDRFLAHLVRLHLLRTPQLRAAMSQGYCLHLDATSDSGKGGLFLCMDGIRGWVLLAERIATENGALLAPLVQQTVELFGDPVATVRDLGNGVAAAVEPLRKRGIRDLVCHYHFLRAVGTALQQQLYDRLRALLRSCAVRSELVVLRRELRPYVQGSGPEGRFGPGKVRDALLALVHWLIEGQGGKDLPFPFAMPHLELVLRCRSANDVASTWLPLPWSTAERRAMRTLDSILHRLDRDRRMSSTITELQERWRVFCELRAVLRLGDSELPGGGQRPRQLPVAAAELMRLHEIQVAVDQYEDDLRRRAGTEANKKRPTKPEAVVLKYLERYRNHLFGHPAIRDDDGQIIAVVERTNNPAEHFFGRGKQLLRRRLGRANLARDLQQQPAQAALVANLRHSDYAQILCGSLENLPDAFARLDRAKVASVSLTRDHRDSRLHRLVGKLLDHSPPPDAALLPQPTDPQTTTHATES